VEGKSRVNLFRTSQSVPANARRTLPAVAGDYFRQGAALVSESATPADFHRFRLTTKTFRYTLELFLPVYGPGLRQHLRNVQKLQQFLGEMQDSEVVIAMDLDDPKLTAYLQRRAIQAKARFLNHWDAEFAHSSRQRRFLHYLARYAKNP
jgi:CHAD domain-containing protein